MKLLEPSIIPLPSSNPLKIDYFFAVSIDFRYRFFFFILVVSHNQHLLRLNTSKMQAFRRNGKQVRSSSTAPRSEYTSDNPTSSNEASITPSPTPIPRKVNASPLRLARMVTSRSTRPSAPVPTSPVEHTPSNTPCNDKNVSSLPIRQSSPHTAGTLFRIAQLPTTQPVALADILSAFAQPRLTAAADATREDLFNTLTKCHEVSLLTRVVDAYFPYIAALAQMSSLQRREGSMDCNRIHIQWQSGLTSKRSAGEAFSLSIQGEYSMVCVLSAMTAIRQVLETPRQFGMGDETQLVQEIKLMKKTSSILQYVHLHVAPDALAQHSGSAPPEIVPSVANALYALTVATAQMLHTKRAINAATSATLLSKLAVAAHRYVLQFRQALEACRRAEVDLSPDFDRVGIELYALARAWMFFYAAQDYDTPAPKVAAWNESLSLLEEARKGFIVGNIARELVPIVSGKRDDASNENKVVYRESVPPTQELSLPQGRSLVTVETFQPPSLPGDLLVPNQ